MLTHNLLVTGCQNNLVIWDVRLPDPVKIVKIGHPDCSQNVKILSHLEDDAIVCSYGSKLRLVLFPTLNTHANSQRVETYQISKLGEEIKRRYFSMKAKFERIFIIVYLHNSDNRTKHA